MARVLGTIAFKMNPDRFDLAGLWIASSNEPDCTNTTVRSPVQERIEVDHIGAVVSGRSRTDDGREFLYDLKVSQNMVYGSYKKKADQAGVQLGAGMIQLIVDLNRRDMTGSVTWYDSDTKQIEHSPVTWKRQ
jgi:hypothetical protein